MDKAVRLPKLMLTIMVLTLIVSVNYANAALTVNMDKKLIPINAFYKGNVLTIKGTVNSGEDVIVKITSPFEKESFMVKEKSIHLFWMNKYKVDVTKVNNVYMLFSSNAIDSILSADEKNKYSIGYNAVRNGVGISGSSDNDRLFREFIKLKEDGKLYSATGNKVILMPSQDGKNAFWLTVKMPYQVPIGHYNIDVYAVSNGVVTEKVSDEVKIEPVGIVRGISDMAMAHGGIYGLLAILIALSTGFMVTPVIAVTKRALVIAITLPKRINTAISGQLSPAPVIKEHSKAIE